MNRLLPWLLPLACLPLCGCPDDQPRRPDPTKGTVTGLVIATDTGKPARFATVVLLPVYDPKDADGPSQSDSVDMDENGSAGIDGRFKIEAVPPGDYYAFAMLDGYVDPTLAVDEHRLGAQATERAKLADEIEQWKDHLVKLTVTAQHTADVSLSIDRGAEIAGTVSYDDSSAAIGIRFTVMRKTAEERWIRIGSNGNDDESLDQKSDGRGRYSIDSLPEGEYRLCALLPVKDENDSPNFCYGGGFRINNAETIKVSAGETHAGVDIVLPLDGLFTVAGSITAGTDAHVPAQATVQLLYADDREKARQTGMTSDGAFSFANVPLGSYILKVIHAQDAVPAGQTPGTGGATASNAADSSSAAPAPSTQPAPAVHQYADREISLDVQNEMTDVTVTLIDVPPPQANH
jgi:hypothetical protein